MDNQQLIDDIVQSNAMLRTQLWILMGVLSFAGIVVVALARATWVEVKSMILDHEDRLKDLEESNAVLNDRYKR